MPDDSFWEFVAAMNRKARSGAYDNLHPIEALKERAAAGDPNARSALLMRTRQDVPNDIKEPPSTEEMDALCST